MAPAVRNNGAINGILQFAMIVRDLGLIPYRDAWAEQERVHAAVVEGAEEQLLAVEHPPVVTLGRRPDVVKNLIASLDELQRRGVELVETDRGGDVTFHGPGQIVIYPIVRLIDHKLSVGGYVHKLEDTIIAALHDVGVDAHRDVCAVGVWVGEKPATAANTSVCDVTEPEAGSKPKNAKIAAIGVRIRRGATLHGLAVNVTTDLSYFDLIVPCGLKNRAVTSIEKLLSPKPVDAAAVKRALVAHLVQTFTAL